MTSTRLMARQRTARPRLPSRRSQIKHRRAVTGAWVSVSCAGAYGRFTSIGGHCLCRRFQNCQSCARLVHHPASDKRNRRQCIPPGISAIIGNVGKRPCSPGRPDKSGFESRRVAVIGSLSLTGAGGRRAEPADRHRSAAEDTCGSVIGTLTRAHRGSVDGDHSLAPLSVAGMGPDLHSTSNSPAMPNWVPGSISHARTECQPRRTT